MTLIADQFKKINSAVEEYINEYELEADEGTYTPTDFEQLLISDAIHGLLENNEFIEAFKDRHKPIELKVTEAASDYKLGISNSEFAGMHNGIDGLRKELFALVDKWGTEE